jgi:hypothetical protein
VQSPALPEHRFPRRGVGQKSPEVLDAKLARRQPCQGLNGRFGRIVDRDRFIAAARGVVRLMLALPGFPVPLL